MENHRLMPGTGESWLEPQFNQIEAQAINDNQEWYNPQLIEPIKILEVTPRAWGVQTVINDNVQHYMQQSVWAKTGMAGQTAMQRYKDIFILTAFNSVGKLYTLSGPFDSTKLRVARTNMRYPGAGTQANPSEPVTGPVRCVMNEFQLDDIENDITKNYAHQNFGQITTGMTQRVWREGFKGMAHGVSLFTNNHIAIRNAKADALVFARKSMVYVSDSITSYETQRLPTRGEGANLMIWRQKGGAAPRRPDIFAAKINTDATAPT